MLDRLAQSFVPVHREGHRIITIAAIVAVILIFVMPPLGWLGALATAAIAYAFRDPDRVVPLRRGLVVAPADGRIHAIDTVAPPVELGLGVAFRTRISIVIATLDVPITRAPVAGIVRRAPYVPGTFMNVALDKASEGNERRGLVIAGDDGSEIAVMHIAGMLGQRVIGFIEEGAAVGTGERVGLVRFGGRVDLYLPPGKGCLVATGQRAIAGETVLADLGLTEAAREARRI